MERHTGDGFAYVLNPDGTAEITACLGRERCLEVPGLLDGHPVTSIGTAAFGLDTHYDEFDDCAGRPWERVRLPAGLRRIGDRAFAKCHVLEEIHIPDSVTEIGVGAFWECGSLGRVTLPKGLISIGRAAFSDCTGLASILIPEGTRTIGPYAFQFCTALKRVDIPDSVTRIQNQAFDHGHPDLVLVVGRDSHAMRYAVQNHISYRIRD